MLISPRSTHFAIRRVYIAAAFVVVLGVGAPATALAARAFGTRVLQQGMSGSDVSTLQKWLTIAGFRTPVAGSFGPITDSNVRRFERAHNLTVDGVVTPPVARVLKAVVQDKTNGKAAGGGASVNPMSSTPTPTTPAPTTTTPAGTGLFGGHVLKSGMRGPSVREMQEYVSAAGFPVSDDGSFGSATQKAVIAFEASKVLAQDGIVSLAVANAMRAAVAAIDANNTGQKAVLTPAGLAVAPVNAPPVVKEVIAAANQIATLPYIYGGGHAAWTDTGYDCSGSTSFALHGAGLIPAPEDSGELESYGQPGPGVWITLFANGGHVYMNVAGLWYDTAAQSSSNGQNRWSTTRISSASGFVVRHPGGL
ncbi:MAG: peptidoglycan-binding protein [Actinomycetota bacterium]|nr:peptidoglycan-binding protein [Actinomycetota bacterium]